ncbi:MAG: hypothetical protein ACPGQL_04780 [Thermoplasmatota archaeon]
MGRPTILSRRSTLAGGSILLILLMASQPLAAIDATSGLPAEPPVAPLGGFSTDETFSILYDAEFDGSATEQVVRAAEAALDVNEEVILAGLPVNLGWLLDQARSNLQVVRDLDAVLEGEDDFARSIALARIASRWQADSLDLGLVEPTPLTGYTLPSEAIKAFLASHGAVPSAEDLREIEALDQQTPEVRLAFARLVDGFMALEVATGLSFEAVDFERVAALINYLTLLDSGILGASELNMVQQAQRPGKMLSDMGIHLGHALATRDQFLGIVLELHETLQDSEILTLETTSGAFAVEPIIAFDIRGFQDSFYDENYILTFDLEGDDTYYNNGGGSNVFEGTLWTDCLVLNSPITTQNPILPIGPRSRVGPGIAAAIDFAGNDVWGDPANPRNCGANGGGDLGVGLLIDRSGEDVYTAGHHGVNGGAHAALALLIDNSEDDVYTGTFFGVNGGGHYGGVGLLVDNSGNDIYTAQRDGFNGGGHRAIGALVEGSGDDQYLGGHHGGNGGGVEGGIGLLVDQTENDIYDSHWIGTNGGVNRGVGLLFDGGQDDQYIGAAPYSDGEARNGIGILLDAGGTDTYDDGPERSFLPHGTVGLRLDLPHLPTI